jgi:hypothetical protein
MKRQMCLYVGCAAALLLVLTQKASAQGVYYSNSPPSVSYYPESYYGTIYGYVDGAAYGAYGRYGVDRVGYDSYAKRYRGGRVYAGGRYGYRGGAGYRRGGFRR